MLQQIKRYAKFAVSLLAPAAAVIESAITDGKITPDETRLILGSLVASALVLLVPNKPASKP